MYFTFKNTLRWIDIVQDLVSAYNKLYYWIIKIAPYSMIKQNKMELWAKLYGQIGKTRQKFKIGDMVCISKVKKTFEKGSLPNWKFLQLVK